MSATVVQFPEGGAYPSMPLSEKDERVLALIRRSLAAERALYAAYDRLDDDCDVEDCSSEIQREFERLHEAACKPKAVLAELAQQDNLFAEWFENIGQAVHNARYRREQA
jgi:hypothetical protein